MLRAHGREHGVQSIHQSSLVHCVLIAIHRGLNVGSVMRVVTHGEYQLLAETSMEPLLSSIV